MRDLDSFYDSGMADFGLPVRAINVAGKYIVGTALRLIFRARYENREILDRLPEGRPVIIAGNHSSYTDPLFVVDCVWPRHIRFIAKAQLFTHFALRRILAWFGVFPVHPGAGGRKAIKRAIASLKRGELVGIFPEGTRVKERDKSKVEHSDGAALIAKMADAIIVPVGIQGTIDISPDGSKRLHFPKVIMRFGEPVDWRDFPGLAKNELFKAVTDEVMRRVYALAEGRDPGPMPEQEGKPEESDASIEAGDAAPEAVAGEER